MGPTISRRWQGEMSFGEKTLGTELLYFIDISPTNMMFAQTENGPCEWSAFICCSHYFLLYFASFIAAEKYSFCSIFYRLWHRFLFTGRTDFTVHSPQVFAHLIAHSSWSRIIKHGNWPNLFCLAIVRSRTTLLWLEAHHLRLRMQTVDYAILFSFTPIFSQLCMSGAAIPICQTLIRLSGSIFNLTAGGNQFAVMEHLEQRSAKCGAACINDKHFSINSHSLKRDLFVDVLFCAAAVAGWND